jgi:hypothetical protein
MTSTTRVTAEPSSPTVPPSPVEPVAASNTPPVASGSSPFEPFLVDYPPTAPHCRLPFFVHSALNNFVSMVEKPVKWMVGHVHPLGWFILHENGTPVYLENPLAIADFWRCWNEGTLKKTKDLEDIDARVMVLRADLDASHQESEVRKHANDLFKTPAQSSPAALSASIAQNLLDDPSQAASEDRGSFASSAVATDTPAAAPVSTAAAPVSTATEIPPKNEP